jgi:hypothetical protein
MKQSDLTGPSSTSEVKILRASPFGRRRAVVLPRTDIEDVNISTGRVTLAERERARRRF